MRARRNRIRRRQPTEQKRKPFFDKQGMEESTPFFSMNKGIQTKLAIGKANDPLEKEADAAARQVMDQPVQKAEQKEEEKPVQKAEQKEEEKPVQKAEQKEEEKPVQKAEQKEEEPVQTKSETEVQAASAKDDQQESDDAARPNLETLLKQRKGGGFPLPDDLRIEMEQKFHADFSQVRIHNDNQAASMCESIHAQAFAHGYDIYFNTGKYNPGSSGGRELLAHELAHVVQQKG